MSTENFLLRTGGVNQCIPRYVVALVERVADTWLDRLISHLYSGYWQQSPEESAVSSLAYRVTTQYVRIHLTLWRLMSYIYMEHPFLMFLDHTQRRSTVGRTPLDE